MPPAIPASPARESYMFCPAIDTWSAGHVEGEDAPGHVTGEDLGQDLSLGRGEGLGELRGAGQNQFGHSFPQRESKTKGSSRVRPLRVRVTAGLLAVDVERGGAPDGDVLDVLELGVGTRDVDHGAGRQRELVRVDLDVAGDADGQTFVDVFLRDSCDSFDLSPICNTFLS